MEDNAKKVKDQEVEIKHLKRKLNFTVKELKRERELHEELKRKWQRYFGCCFCGMEVFDAFAESGNFMVGSNSATATGEGGAVVVQRNQWENRWDPRPTEEEDED